MSFNKDKVSIVQLAEQYGVVLDPSNNDFVGLCPFHPDNDTKSLHLYTHSNSFYCFGCHTAGTIFDFVMKYDGISFKEAVEKLDAGSVDEFDLSDVDIKSTQKFNTHREMIETTATGHLRTLYFQMLVMKTDKITVKTLVEELWQWYDNAQVKFDIKSSEGANENVLIQKMNDFYIAFNRKLQQLQTELSAVS